MIGQLRALLRLASLQASWTYERMQGVGVAVAEEPLLRPLDQYPARAVEARGRSAQYFNSHPYLAGIGVGALARAELDGETGERILRLRTALSGPLGALGDQLFWAGVLPALMGAALFGVSLGGGLLVVGVVVLLYNAIRFGVTAWGLRIGYAEGIKVAHAVSASWLPRMAPRAGRAAGLAVGAAIPAVAGWLMAETATVRGAVPLVVALALGFALVTLRRPLPTPLLTLGAAGLILLWRWSGL